LQFRTVNYKKLKEKKMKRVLILAMAIIFAVGMVFTGCKEDPKEDPIVFLAPSNTQNGTNLVTEEAILAATGVGGTIVTKTANGYEVSGKVTSWSNWDGSIQDKRITLSIPADPSDENKYFAGAHRYMIKINFPKSAVKPLPEYTDGFRIYLENVKGTENTAIWGGTWAREWPDEYNAIGGVGKISINRNLEIDPNTEGSESNVGDYHSYNLVLGFDDADVGKNYKFTISNVGVFGVKIDDTYPGPEGHTPVIWDKTEEGDGSLLDDATYAKDATAAALRVVPMWSEFREDYVHEWYVNTANSATGGTLITSGVGTNGDHPIGEWRSGTSYIPPTDTIGILYYYVVVSYEGNSAVSRVVKITVN